MGKEYGMAPTDAMDRPASRFWMDAKIRAAGVAWENEQQQKANDASTSAGAATSREKADLVDDQEDRADRREAQDGQPSLADQADALGGDQ